jgi:hypothetical protein
MRSYPFPPRDFDFRRRCLTACASALLATLAGSGALSQSFAQAPSKATNSRPDPAVKDYLWEVYQRSTVKKDGSGEFTWKDIDASKHAGLSMAEYTIGGIDPDFRELVYAIGQAMDAAGIEWSILSGYRDDYRQNLASGFKSHGGYSFHGGSTATGGYGHGCAMDISSPDRLSDDKVWAWFDQHSKDYGLRRPLPATDPVHIQPLLGPAWHEKAAALRRARLAASGNADRSAGSDVAEQVVFARTAADAGVSPEQWGCVRPKGQETAHSEDKVHRNARLAEEKVAAHHGSAPPTESLYKPASVAHTDVKPNLQHPDAKRTPQRADAKPALPHGETKPLSQRTDVKPQHGEGKPPAQHADTKPAAQRSDTKPAPPRGDNKSAPQRTDAKPAPAHGEVKPPSAQNDKANTRAGTTKRAPAPEAAL